MKYEYLIHVPEQDALGGTQFRQIPVNVFDIEEVVSCRSAQSFLGSASFTVRMNDGTVHSILPEDYRTLKHLVHVIMVMRDK